MRALVLFFLLLLLPTLPAFPQAVRSTILTNGPSANRVNLVVLSEGYTTNQLSKFLIDATNQVNNLLSTPPYQEYRSYFNAFAISIASVEAGSDHPSAGVFKNTYFNSSYDSYGLSELITIPPNDRDANANNGQGKVINLLTNLVPEYDLVMLLVNDLQYGGSGGSFLISSLHVDSAEIVRHESGHTFADLADEYGDPFPGYVPVEKPNATAQTNLAQVKWNAWITPGTPLPTPPDPTNAAVVGLFEGAQYQFNGWYRPKLDCKMRTLGVPFCEICSEALVKSMYEDIRPIDAFTPATNNLNISGSQPVMFGVTPLQPASHSLYIQWYTNNAAVAGETNATFQFQPGSVGTGTHTIRAVVYDPTPLVRTDPGNLLRATNTWSVTVGSSPFSLYLTEPLWLTNNRFRLTVTGTAPQGFVIQASSNLVNWVSLSTNNLTANRFDYTNSSLTNMLRRFYRAYTPP